jgi:hypothetical protein
MGTGGIILRAEKGVRMPGRITEMTPSNRPGIPSGAVIGAMLIA